MHRMLATRGNSTVAHTVAGMNDFVPMPESSYLAYVSDGSVVIYGESAQFDEAGTTVLEPRANIHEACEFFSTFEATRGVRYVVICSDGRKVEIRLRSVEEELVLQRALEKYHRDTRARSCEP